MARRRVVVTGMGVITPVGLSVPEMMANLLAGKSGAGSITRFDARTFPTSFACEVKNYQLGQFVPNPERFVHAELNTLFSLGAAKQALDQANVASLPNRERIGIYLGCGEGSGNFRCLAVGAGMAADESGRNVNTGTFVKLAREIYQGPVEAEQEMHSTNAHLADEFNLEGPNYSCLTACAASAQAIGEAVEIIRYGDADLMLAGGSHSMINPFGVTGFNLLTALSTRSESPATASRPFDLTRDGFVLGEGAGMLVLEEYEHARKRGATIFAEMTGYGTTGDAYRMTDPHPDGLGAAGCMKMALEDSGLTPRDIGYINAHGTSTPANDEAETAGIKSVFGDQAYKTPVSSTKSMMGHLIGAGGAVELIVCIEAMRGGVLPPTMNLHTPDPKCDLDYIPNAARPKPGIQHVLSNSFGFGGQNISLIASRV
ncbi:MAG: beta-ketoacyl-[acyl-carrier-protein] synthase II [Gemmataceae bacterium]